MSNLDPKIRTKMLEYLLDDDVSKYDLEENKYNNFFEVRKYIDPPFGSVSGFEIQALVSEGMDSLFERYDDHLSGIMSPSIGVAGIVCAKGSSKVFVNKLKKQKITSRESREWPPKTG